MKVVPRKLEMISKWYQKI